MIMKSPVKDVMHLKTTRELSKTKTKKSDFLVLAEGAAYINALLPSSDTQLSKDNKAKDL